MSEYRYCPVCAASLAVTEDAEGHKRLGCVACGFTLYRNPIPSGNALVVAEGKILLVQRGVEPHKGCWDIPGGFLESREHPEEGARREVREETGLEVEILELLGIFIAGYPYGSLEDSTMNLYYMARPVGGLLRPGSDASAVGWFKPDAIPDEIAFRSCRDALDAWKRRLGVS